MDMDRGDQTTIRYGGLEKHDTRSSSGITSIIVVAVTSLLTCRQALLVTSLATEDYEMRNREPSEILRISTLDISRIA